MVCNVIIIKISRLLPYEAEQHSISMLLHMVLHCPLAKVTIRTLMHMFNILY